MRRDQFPLFSSCSLFFLLAVGLVPTVAQGAGDDGDREKVLAVFYPYCSLAEKMFETGALMRQGK